MDWIFTCKYQSIGHGTPTPLRGADIFFIKKNSNSPVDAETHQLEFFNKNHFRKKQTGVSNTYAKAILTRKMIEKIRKGSVNEQITSLATKLNVNYYKSSGDGIQRLNAGLFTYK